MCFLKVAFSLLWGSVLLAVVIRTISNVLPIPFAVAGC